MPAHAQLGPVGLDTMAAPAHDGQQPPLQLLVARVVGLGRGRDGVDVVAGGQRGQQPDVERAGWSRTLRSRKRPGPALALDDVAESGVHGLVSSGSGSGSLSSARPR